MHIECTYIQNPSKQGLAPRETLASTNWQGWEYMDNPLVPTLHPSELQTPHLLTLGALAGAQDSTTVWVLK